MAITYYSANRILDRNFGLTTLTPPSTWYLGLSLTPGNIDGTGMTEPSTGSYARIAVANDKSSFSTAASAALTNLLSFSFAESTASWGTITYVGMWDAITSGNLWYFDILTPSRSVATATTVLFAASAFNISMTNS